MYKKFLLVCLLLAGMERVNAQDENDALRYGQVYYFGTARAMAIGNASGSFGGDFSSLSVNPAGLGMFHNSEFSFSPSLNMNGIKTEYSNNVLRENTSKMNFNQMGVVLANKDSKNGRRNKNWRYINFGIGMNRLANFKNNYTYAGKDNQSSLVEVFAQEFNNAGGLNSNTLNAVSEAAYGAYQTYLVDKDYNNDSTQAFSYVPYWEGLERTVQKEQNGYINEYVLTLAGNYREKIFIGATLGIPQLSFSSITNITEQDISGNKNNDFDQMFFSQELVSTGSGVNLKLGLIYKLSQNFRFGLSAHTPTSYQLKDYSSIFISSDTDSLLLKNGGTTSYSSYAQSADNISYFNYSYRSPGKLLGSATYLFANKGFISADVEYVGYNNMRYNFGSGYINEAKQRNTIIQNTYKSTVNFRLGGEAIINKIALRTGYALYGNPFENETKKSQILSAGLGYRHKAFFADFALQYATLKSTEQPYYLQRIANIPQASISNNTTNASATIGWKF